ncbi:MAG: zinc ABC transporter ATP-binding protein ZnuC [Gammaproteobacteria bacterium]|nr:MAG: zinc ABC transporter ATP-binding protein ZnuC [Gammaproteobacteria bacterium]
MSITATPLIESHHASLTVNKQVLLTNISLQLREGEIVTVIGPNGAGKTTLLKLLIGEYRPDSGSVQRSKNCRIGYMPQRLHIDNSLPLTVNRFLAMSGNRDRQEMLHTLQEVGASHVEQAAVQTLSGGELQRVLLARALLRNPNLLVLDEPAQGVDLHGQRELYQLLGNIRNQRGCGILMVSHDLHFVMAGTNHVICLNQHICCSGSADSVAQHPEYQALFGDELGKDIAIYTHHHDHHHDLDGEVVDETDHQHQGCRHDHH